MSCQDTKYFEGILIDFLTPQVVNIQVKSWDQPGDVTGNINNRNHKTIVSFNNPNV